MRSPKAAEAKTAQENERSSSIPSLEDLERMMKEMDTEMTQPKKIMQDHENASANLDKDLTESPLPNDPESAETCEAATRPLCLSS